MKIKHVIGLLPFGAGIVRRRRGVLAFCLSLISLLILTGSREPTAQAAEPDLSGPPVFSQKWQTRLPRECSKVTNPPNALQAAALVQCTMEYQSSQVISLMQEVKVEVGGPRPFIAEDSSFSQIDPSSKVYPIRGSEKMYLCGSVIENVSHNTGKNCSYFAQTKAEGRCWKTKFGDWRCSLAGGGDGTQTQNQPGPTTY
jgi:hypothetical protein